MEKFVNSLWVPGGAKRNWHARIFHLTLARLLFPRLA